MHQSLGSNPVPWGKKKRKESRDIDLALFMPNAIGSGARCFTLCLHREAAMRPKKRKHNQEGTLFVVCSGCESESVTACVWALEEGIHGVTCRLFSEQEIRDKNTLHVVDR